MVICQKRIMPHDNEPRCNGTTAEHDTMNITILGTESLGVRGLACAVRLGSRKIVIDPGIALGWSRHGLLPHPFQIAIGARIRAAIIAELATATDVVFSHFDGDHCPLDAPNPYQLGLREVTGSLARCRIWARGPHRCPPAQQGRRARLAETIGCDLPGAEGVQAGPLEFSFPVPHGPGGRTDNMVMMTRITAPGLSFVHASDIQLLDPATVSAILAWEPDIVLASGPPLYRYTSPPRQDLRERARENALALSRQVGTLIIDHHLLRSLEGIAWLRQLQQASKNRVLCAADFMQRRPLFLEARRRQLYDWMPVPEGWHEGYAAGRQSAQPYRIRGWEVLERNRIITPCKWYAACPVRLYTRQGLLERDWIEQYCLVGSKTCRRYRMEERGEYHPANMLPDGSIRKDLAP